MILVKPNMDVEIANYDEGRIGYVIENYEFQDGDKVFFQVRDTSGRILINKTISTFDAGRAFIEFVALDTGTLTPGTYSYDLKAVCPLRIIKETLIENRKFIIKRGIQNS